MRVMTLDKRSKNSYYYDTINLEESSMKIIKKNIDDGKEISERILNVYKFNIEAKMYNERRRILIEKIIIEEYPF